MKYKEYVIPKKSGKTRKIVAPDDELKQFQRNRLRRLESIFNKEIKAQDLPDNVFHGFLHARNCVTAAQRHVGYKATIMMDISNFFDSVYANHIHPKYKLDAKLFHKEGHAAQGFPTSPMIANIAAIPVMVEIVEKVNQVVSTDNVITIYADDVSISLNNVESIPLVQKIVKRAFNSHGFTINEKKTRVKYSSHGYRRILGINVGDDHIRATRKTMRKIRAAKHQASHNKTAARSAGGLTTWSKCLLPRKARPPRIDMLTIKKMSQWGTIPVV